MPEKTKQIVYIDASSLKSDSLCDRRYLLHIVRGYTKGHRAANYKAGYGTAFHAFLESYYALTPPERNAKIEGLIEIGLQAYKKYEPHVDLSSVFEFRTAEHLRNTMVAYHERYRLGDSLVPLPFKIPNQNIFLPGEDTEHHLLETKFCIPWYEDENLVIYLTGTIDMVADYFGQVIIVDHKSTAQQPANIPRFFEEFRMNIQTQFYVRQFRQLSGMDHYVPIMINGIFVKKPTQIAAKAGKFDGVNLQRSTLIEYSDSQMEQFEDYLIGKLGEIKALIRNTAPENLGSPNYAACHGRFQSCMFYEMCSYPRNVQEKFLKSNYFQEIYNPLHFND